MSGNPFDPFGGAATAAPSPIQSYSSPNPYAAYGAQAAMGQQLGQQHGQQYSTQQAYGMSPEAQHQQTPEQQQYGVQQYSGMQQQQYSAPAPAQQDPWASQAQAQTPQQQPQAPQTVAAYGQQQQQQPQMQSYQQPSPVPSYQQASPAPAGNGGYNPFAASPSHQMVVSQQQSNPYADMVSPAPPAPMPATQSLVPAAQQTSPWGMPPNQGYGSPAPVGGGYDPFAPPAPPPVPVPAPPPPQAPAPPSTEPENPFGDFLPASPEPAPAPAPVDQKPPTEVAIVPSQERQMQQYASGYGQESQQQNSESRAMVPAPPSPARNKYSGELARRAPPGASPLPKAELVKKSGYVLSRISFRTIVMKKWKQSYWVQYGSHTMLWFRSDSDFNDWLNNPYHSQAQRNFLIKLAVNFVHDLYKPNVRGYQVTQCRVKPYGNKMVRQFKLERWMDYGPTIAAAFGSYDPKEVDGLREAIVECMRNTPLGNGIRATGAVRQAPERDLASSADDEEYGNGHHHHQDDNSEANQRYNSGGTFLWFGQQKQDLLVFLVV